MRFLYIEGGFMKGKRVSYILTVLFIMVLSSVSLAAVPVQVSIDKGTIITVKEPSARVFISNPDIADMNLISPSEILINGKKAGTTNLIVWDKKGKPTFFDVIVFGDLTALKNQLKELAPDTDVTVETAQDSIVLRGSLKNEQTKKKLELVAKAYGPKVLNLLVVEEAQQVLLEVKVAQINKTKLKELGINYLVKGIGSDNAEFTAPGLITSPDGTIGGGPGFDVTPGIGGFDIGTFTPQIALAHFPSGVATILRALVEKDYGKILAEPNLIVRSGETGNFHVGSRIPIQTVTGTGGAATVSVTYEEVGIRLNFAPEVLETGVIRLKINPAEVSSVARFITFQGIVAPEIDTRTVKTSVDLKEGESLILAGLLSDEMKKNSQKVPVLGDIPILGLLFRSTRDELEQTELAFFITPRLVKPIPEGEMPELPTDKPLSPDEEREFKWIPFPGSSK
jgi:pilus assembly protein CpaC